MGPGRAWIVKTEPATYSWDHLVAEGGTCWDGVRNAQAAAHLRAMAVGDELLVYHSQTERAIVGVARVTRAAAPDPGADDPRWVAVEIAPVRPLARPVTLAELKAEPALAGMALVRQPRLSVVPLSSDERQLIGELEARPLSR